MHVLVLDDNLELRDKFQSSLKKILSKNKVVCVESRDRLFDEYTKEKADVVFIRLGNTAFNGLNVAKELHEMDTHVNLVFISRSRDYAVYAFKAGAKNYLLEPIDEVKLNEVLFETV